MEDIIVFARDYYVISIFFLYFAMGRFALMAAVVFSLGSPLVAGVLIIGFEIIQIPVFFNFYSVIMKTVSRIKLFFLKKKQEAAQNKQTDHNSNSIVKENKEKKNRFLERFGKYGQKGVFLLAALPLRGCGIWSSLLLGKSLSVKKWRLYSMVAFATVAGNMTILLFGVLFNKSALAFIESMNLDPSIMQFFK